MCRAPARKYTSPTANGTFASAVASGRLVKLDDGALTSALGRCGSMAAGILVVEKSWLKRLYPGWAAHSALAAAALGTAGFKGQSAVFESARGFYATPIEATPEGDRAPSFELGQHLQSLGIALKPYPCCHFIHSFVDAALELRGQFELQDIDRIDCALSSPLRKIVAEPRECCIYPVDPYAALFSVHYVVAVALARGRVDLATFHDEPLDAADVRALAEKTYCTVDPNSDFPLHFPGEVNVTLKDGRVFGCRKALASVRRVCGSHARHSSRSSSRTRPAR